jgi:hypothetical protein
MEVFVKSFVRLSSINFGSKFYIDSSEPFGCNLECKVVELVSKIIRRLGLLCAFYLCQMPKNTNATNVFWGWSCFEVGCNNIEFSILVLLGFVDSRVFFL